MLLSLLYLTIGLALGNYTIVDDFKKYITISENNCYDLLQVLITEEYEFPPTPMNGIPLVYLETMSSIKACKYRNNDQWNRCDIYEYDNYLSLVVSQGQNLVKAIIIIYDDNQKKCYNRKKIKKKFKSYDLEIAKSKDSSPILILSILLSITSLLLTICVFCTIVSTTILLGYIYMTHKYQYLK